MEKRETWCQIGIQTGREGWGRACVVFPSGEEIPQWYYVKIFFIYLQIHANVYCVDLCYDKRSYKISALTACILLHRRKRLEKHQRKWFIWYDISKRQSGFNLCVSPPFPGQLTTWTAAILLHINVLLQKNIRAALKCYWGPESEKSR